MEYFTRNFGLSITVQFSMQSANISKLYLYSIYSCDRLHENSLTEHKMKI